MAMKHEARHSNQGHVTRTHRLRIDIQSPAA